MGKIVLDLAEYADEDKQVVNKPLKLWIADGEFASVSLFALHLVRSAPEREVVVAKVERDLTPLRMLLHAGHGP